MENSILIRWLAMPLMVVTLVPLMGGFGPGVARADDYLLVPSELGEGLSMSEGWILGGAALFEENRYGLHLQLDCNLVLYPHGSQKPLWASNTAGRAQHCYLIMQEDCNAVLYETESGTLNPLWASQTAGRGFECRLQVQLDGNVVVYDGHDVALWATNTVQD